MLPAVFPISCASNFLFQAPIATRKRGRRPRLPSYLLFGIALVIVPAASGAQGDRTLLPPLSCAEESKTASGRSNVGAPITTMDVENGTDHLLQVFQIDAGGKKRDLAWRLRPQYGARAQTFAGEVWVVADQGGNCMAVFRATASPNRIRLGDQPMIFGRGIPPYAMRVSLLKGRSLSDDGKGEYVDGIDSVSAGLCEALNLWLDVIDPAGPWAPCGNPERHNPPGRVRILRFDLTHPLAESGAMKRMVVEDGVGNVHVFWRRDQQAHLADAVQAIPAGSTVESDRVQLAFHSEGERYALQFGTWVPGEFNPTPGMISGAGTTTATITRASKAIWRVDAPEGSIGRLWAVTDPKHPNDLCLYRFSFGLQFELLPEVTK